MIAAAPFRDRVVHHALINIIEPPVDKQFIYDYYQVKVRILSLRRDSIRFVTLSLCVENGYLAVRKNLQGLANLEGLVRMLNLLDKIIDTALQRKNLQGLANLEGLVRDDLLTPVERRIGIPIGNLTSQFLANFYLDDFDHYIKEQLNIQAYLRYVDDFIVLDDDKNRLNDLRELIREYLARNRLRLHPRKAHIIPTRQGLEVLGYIVFPHKRLLRNDNGHRFFRKLRGFGQASLSGKRNFLDFKPSIRSWVGHAKHADTYGLRCKIFADVVF
ncbi:MAG: RNA-dependent DNA polymerase [Candidatus Parabeggiatoa sp. nov. 1]|nr:MAG: RNA-dependent DNA polymerase [Gammaproteobacteria bacterium]